MHLPAAAHPGAARPRFAARPHPPPRSRPPPLPSLTVALALGLTSLPARLALRLLLVSGCYALVLSLTNLATLIDLVGAVANTVLAALPSAIHAKLLLSRAALREPADTVRLNGDAAALPEPRPCHRRLARALSRLWSEVARRSGGGGGSRDDVAPLSTPAGATCDASLEASDANGQRGRAPDRFPRLSHAELLSLATDALIICFCALVMCAGLYHAATAPTPSNPGEPATNTSMVAHPVTRE